MHNVVTLKRSGEIFRCETAKLGSAKLCKGKFFRLDAHNPNRSWRTTFYCVTCGSPYGGSEFEAQLPPRNDWRTPPLWKTLHAEYLFTFDAAADAANTKIPGSPGVTYFDGLTPETDALLQPWRGRVWCNPPYQPKGSVETWLQRGLDQAALGVFSVFLVPMASSVAWFNDFVVPYAEWHTFRGRIMFEDPLASSKEDERNSPKQDNLLVIYNPYSETVGHTAVRDAKTGARLWTRPG